jgi:hypothetical protein
MANDDLDAVAVSDVGLLGVLDPGLDEALFSLHPGSDSVRFGPDGVPGTGDEVSAADVFYTRFLGNYFLYASSGTLGLLFSDNVNAIDIQPANLYPQPVPPPPPPPAPVKKLTGEAALLAAHGIRVPEKKPCVHFMQGDVIVFLPQVGDLLVPVQGPAEVESSAPAFDPETARSEIATEIVFMDLIGEAPPFGPVFTRAGRHAPSAFPLEPTTGEITQITPGIDFPAESFFDVYVEIEIPDAGLILRNQEPFRMEAVVDEIPPYGETYGGAGPPVILYDQTGLPAGELLAATLITNCQSDSECDDNDPCTADSCDMAAGACVHNPLPDLDGDGVCDVADNCPQYPNSGGQAPLVFGQEVSAISPLEFCWPDAADVHWVKGDLDFVSAYLVDTQQHLGGAICFVHPPDPPPGGGYYYLVALDCPAASWQNSLGLEPRRDLDLP